MLCELRPGGPMGLQRENREERMVNSQARLPEQTELEAESVGGGLTGGSLRGLSTMSAPVCLVYIYVSITQEVHQFCPIYKYSHCSLN